MTALSEASLDALVAAATAARERAYAPYSKFRMGAAILTDAGVTIQGALVENVSLGLAMCAERAALFAVVAQAAGRPVALALVAPRTDGSLTFPCGACLQVAAELGRGDLVVVAAAPDESREVRLLQELAPHLPLKKSRGI